MTAKDIPLITSPLLKSETIILPYSDVNILFSKIIILAGNKATYYP